MLSNRDRAVKRCRRATGQSIHRGFAAMLRFQVTLAIG
jgi:hypothetical protein